MPKLFDYVNDLSYQKKRLIDEQPENEKEINQYLINRAFSFGPDTVMYANDMNKCGHITNSMFYEFYFHALRPAKRFNKWLKKPELEYVPMIQKLFNLSYKKAVDAVSVLTIEQLEEIRSELDEGGFEKAK